MKNISDKEELLTRFLLGAGTERERAEVEDRLLSDEEFYEQMVAAEGDLMDAYARGELASRERALFEERFFSSQRQRERVEFARGLAESTTLLHKEESEKTHSAVAPAESVGRRGLLAFLFAPPPAFRYALAAAVLVVMAVAVWLLIARMRAPVEPQQARTEGVAPQTPPERPPVPVQDGGEVVSPQPGASPLPKPGGATPEARPPERERQTRARTVFATFTLAPGALRDGSSAGILVIPRDATHVRLRLELEGDDYQQYRAKISTPEGRSVWTGAARKDRATDARAVTITLPAASLKSGDYIVELSAPVANGRSEPAAQYSFRIMPQ